MKIFGFLVLLVLMLQQKRVSGKQLRKEFVEAVCSANPSRIDGCNAAMKVPRYYYLKEAGSCVRLHVPGCGDSRNSFATEAECMNFCGQTAMPTNESSYEKDFSGEISRIPTPQTLHRFKRADNVGVAKQHRSVKDKSRLPYSAMGKLHILFRTERLTHSDVVDIRQAGGTWNGVDNIGSFVEIYPLQEADDRKTFYGLKSGGCSAFLLEHCRLVATAGHCFKSTNNIAQGLKMKIAAVYYIPAPSTDKVLDETLDIYDLYRQKLQDPEHFDSKALAAKNVFWVKQDSGHNEPEYYLNQLYLQNYAASAPETTDSPEYAGFDESLSSVDFAFLTLEHAPANTGFLVLSNRPYRRSFEQMETAYVAGFPAVRKCGQPTQGPEVLVKDPSVLMVKEVGISLPAFGVQNFPYDQRMIYGPICLSSGVSGGPIMVGNVEDESKSVTWQEHFKIDVDKRSAANIFVASIMSGWTYRDAYYGTGPRSISPILRRDHAIHKARLGDDFTCAPGFDPSLDGTDTDNSGGQWNPSNAANPRYPGQKPFKPSRSEPFAPGDEGSVDQQCDNTQPSSLDPDQPLYDYCSPDEECDFVHVVDATENDGDEPEEPRNLVFAPPPETVEEDASCHNTVEFDVDEAGQCCEKPSETGA